ncbi:MAG: hormogonium polysaccharide secretion pseudopilin HpsC [Spirirestis rafaelensis WJT71-NPBG6]|jgi:prepilin-type N-terminal cleavage/methylation domain-containing protein|nr:hormogonium polysaccharide secretion pseudopilin HpsC [Spirirestis rafaelensis WJT71-NPBG6]
MNTLRWLLTNQLKRSQQHKENGGYTLIELLVAMIMAALVITPLLGVMINILDTDRKEQAKTNSEQEVQAAIDYISRDLQQAMYIYDATGVDAIKNQLPTDTNINPVLVFWKREFVKDAAITKTKDKEKKDVTFTDDSFVYSLVAYYLIKDNKDPWSKAARIARFQIRDGVPNKNGNICSTAYDTSGKYTECPDDGFQQVNLVQKGKTLEEKMNSWKKTSQAYKQKPIVLVDFIDQTTTDKGALAASCPTGLAVVPSSITMTGFYTCVDSVSTQNRSVAEVYLRGNALARLINQENKMLYNPSQTTYFPTAKIRLEGRSFIFSK